MATLSLLDASAALVATIVVAQSLTLGTIQGLRMRDALREGVAADSEAHRKGLPAPASVTPPGTWLLLTLLLAAVVAFGDLVQHLGLALLDHWLSPLHGAALLLIGPAMWFYALAITQLPADAPPNWRRFVRHAIPASLMSAGLGVMVLMYPWNCAAAAPQRTWGDMFILVPVATHILLYLAAVVRRLRRQRPRLEEHFSRVQHRQLRWLEAGAWTFGLLVLVWVASWTLPVAVSDIITNGLLAVDVAVLGIFGARQRNVLGVSPCLGEVPCRRAATPQSPQAWTAVLAPTPSAGQAACSAGAPVSACALGGEQKAGKYAKSMLPAPLARAISDRLARHVATDKPYLECDLTLGELAAAVQATQHQLSQVLSTQLGVNFFDYINALRVEAVKTTLARPQAAGRPLLEIAMECGFGSKSAFNEAFKRATGMSPSVYRRSLPATAVVSVIKGRQSPVGIFGRSGYTVHGSASDECSSSHP